MIANALDWQCAAASNILKQLIGPEESNAPPDLTKVARILQSAGRSVSQLQREQITSLANLTVRRQDAYLKQVPNIPEDLKSQLRTEEISGKTLFSEIEDSAGQDQRRL